MLASKFQSDLCLEGLVTFTARYPLRVAPKTWRVRARLRKIRHALPESGHEQMNKIDTSHAAKNTDSAEASARRSRR